MRVFLITGFALDKRAFAFLDLPPERFVLADLIPARPRESLRDYALRLGEGLGCTSGDVIGGVSLGGMLALEIAKAKGARGLILMASCTHPRWIRKRFLLFAPIARFVPDAVISRLFTLIPWYLARQRMLTPEGQALLADVMGAFPPALLKALPMKMLRWKGCAPCVPLRQLHSRGDWLIRRNGDPVTLEGRNHLVTVSHPVQVREFLLAAEREFAGESRGSAHSSA